MMSDTGSKEQIYEKIIGSVPGLVFTVDKDGIITSLYGKMVDKVGLSSKKTVGKPLVNIFGITTNVRSGILLALDGKENRGLFAFKGFTFDAEYSALKDEDGKRQALVVATDVSAILKQSQDNTLLRTALVMNRIMSVATSSLETEKILQTMCAELGQAMNLASSGFALLQKETKTLKVIAEYRRGNRLSAMGLEISLEGNPASKYVIDNNKPLAISDLVNDEGQKGFKDHALEQGIASILIVPLAVRNEVIGTLGLDSDELHEFTAEEITLAEEVAAVASQMLETTQLYDSLQKELLERKQVEESLRISESRYRRAIMAADAVPYYIDYASESYIFMGEGVERLTGYTMQEMNPTLLGSLILETVMHGESTDLEREEAIKKTREGKAADWKADYRIKNRAGEIRWLSDSSIQIHDDSGKPVGAMGILQDVTTRKNTEEAIRQSQQRLSLMVEQSPLAVIEWNLNFEVASWNPAAERIFGYSAKEAAGRHAADLIIPDEARPVVDKVWQDLLQQSGGTHSTNKNTTKDGRNITCEWYNSPIVDASGVVIGVTSLVEDVTEQDLAETRLRESEEQYRRAIVAADAVPYFIDYKTEQYRFIGEAIEKITGYKAEEFNPAVMGGLTKQTIMTGKNIGHTYEESVKLTREGKSVEWKADYRIEDRFGKTHWVSDSSVQVLNEEGTPIGAIGILQDITDRKLNEEAIQESQQRLALIIQQSPLAVIEWNTQYEVVSWNPAAETIFGYKSREANGKHAAALIIPESDRQNAEKEWQVLLQQIGGTRSTTENITKDGQTIICEWFNTPLIDEMGEVMGVTSLVEDVTERKRMEREIQESLERRGYQVEVSREVAQEISTAPDLDTLFPMVVKLIKERFNYYHAQIFRFEKGKDAVELASGYGEAGQKMLAAGHKRMLGEGVVGMAAKTGVSILTPDTQQDKNWQPNPFLPDTKGELAVPIKFRDAILGILDVQSDKANALTRDDALLLENLASQIALVIVNTRTLEEALTFRALVDEASQGIAFADLRGKLAYLNATMLRMLGVKNASDVLGRHVLNFYSKEQHQLIENILAEVSKTGQWTGELDVQPIEGAKLIPTINNIFLVRDRHGNPQYFASAVTDITERKRAELETQETLLELERLTKSLSQSGWQDYEDELGAGTVLYDNLQLLTNEDLQIPEIARAMEENATLKTDDSQYVISPLSIRGQVVGALGLLETESLSEEDIQLVEAVSEQVALALESSRLFNQTRAALGQANTFRQLVNATSQGIVMAGLDASMVYTNRALTELYTGNPNQNLAGQNVNIFFAPEVQEIVSSQVIPEVFEKEQWTGELGLTTVDGKEVPTINNIFIIKDDNGNPQFLANIITDITERKASEERLLRQNAYLATATDVGRLVTSTLDMDILFTRTVELIRGSFGFYFAAIFTLDESGFNALLREGTGEAGLSMKESGYSVAVGSRTVIGQATATARTLVVNNSAADPLFRENPALPDTRSEMAMPLRIGERVIGAIDLQSTNTEAFSREDIAVLEILADQVAVAIENARSYDLAQKAIEEMRQMDILKSQFLANMSHELRTPLNSIIGFSRVILKGIDGPINEQQQQDLSAIYNSGQHLLGLINDILDLSKIEAGKMELALDEVNIGDTIHSVMSTTIGLVKDKPIKLKEEIEPNIPTIRADPMRLRQILINLVSNASKFTEEGSITVRAEIQKNEEGRKEVLVSVTDTGPGISEEGQQKLFKAFSQVDGSATRKTGGTGLGLSISQQLVRMHGGSIGVKSEVGKGSTFYFTMPLFHEEQSLDTDNKVVLCIDDDSQVISLYERYLKPQGYQVVALTDPEKARETVKKVKPYAITLDIMMPGFDGWQVINELKSDPETRDFPVIICSIVEEEEKGFSLGAADYLNKPIMEDDLLNALTMLNGDASIQEVMVIDDDPDDLRLIEKILSERSQYKTILAEGGQKGWDMMNEKQPQAVILDLFMPDLDGFSILERIRMSPKLRDVPVVVISGVDLNSEQKKQLDNLGKRLLQKGMINEKELFSTLEKALKRLETKQQEPKK